MVNQTIENPKIINETEEEEDIWFSILNSVSSTKITQCKNVIVLGDSNSGKSTIIKEILSRHPTEKNMDISKYALSYSYIDINEEEDTVAHIGLYRLAGNTTFKSLIPYALTPETIQHSIAIISLSWEDPSTFLNSLEQWLNILEEEIKKNISKELLTELQNNIEKSIHSYIDPSSEDTKKSEIEIDNSTLDEINIPLAEGCLIKNIGIPIIVVCTKSDMIEELENKNKKEFSDEKFEYIQQVLRTVCLEYGASLIYVTTKNPNTFDILNSYLLSKLFNSENSTLSKSMLKNFIFNEPAKYIDKSSVFIPSGWDSKGRINLLREEFDGIVDKNEYRKIVYSTKLDSPSIMDTFYTADDDQKFLAEHLSEFSEESFVTKDSMKSYSKYDKEDSIGNKRNSQSRHSSSFSIGDNKININLLNKLKESVSPTNRKKDKSSKPLQDSTNIESLLKNSSLKTSSMSEALQNPEALKNFFGSLINKSGSSSNSNSTNI